MHACLMRLLFRQRDASDQTWLWHRGFDAHWRDPLAHMQVSLAGFARMAQVLCRLSDELCDGRLVAVLEGGYDLDALSFGVMNMLRILQGHADDFEDPLGPCADDETS